MQGTGDKQHGETDTDAKHKKSPSSLISLMDWHRGTMVAVPRSSAAIRRS
jgi:hypothetical protein